MDTLTFLTKLLEHAAWPAAAIVIVLALRKEIQSLLATVKKFKAGPVEVELEQVVKELEATKKVAAAAEATAQVVAAKLDESEEQPVENTSPICSSEKAAPPANETELRVLKAIVESKFVSRTVSGVAKETGLSKGLVQTTYGALISKGFLEQITNSEGNLRWRATSSGRVVAHEA